MFHAFAVSQYLKEGGFALSTIGELCWVLIVIYLIDSQEKHKKYLF